MARQTWGEKQARIIEKAAKDRYGAGWGLMSEDQRDNYRSAQILRLVMAQAGEKFQPAQSLAQQVFEAFSGASSDD